MGIQEILIVLYLGAIISVALAGDRRTCGIGGALLMAIFATPVVAAILILAYPSRIEAEAHFKSKAEAAKDSIK